MFIAGLGAALLVVPSTAEAKRPKRPNLWVTVHNNHPLEASLGDEVAAPMAAVVRALREVEAWSSWVPMVSRSDIVSQASSTTTFDGVLDLPWPVRDRSFRADAQPSGSSGLELHRIAGFGNMGDFDVTLTVNDLGDGRSRVDAEATIDFGLRLTKGFIEWLVRIKAPQLFEALELRAQA